MKKLLSTINFFGILNFGVLLMAIGIYFFKTPNGFATGGVSGIAVILHNLLPFNITTGTYMLVINALLLVLGVIILGKECGALTVYCTMMISLINWGLEFICPMEGITLTNYPLLELVYAILLTGIGSAILFKYKASSGGTDIAALILKKYTSMNVGSALLCTDLLIAAATFIKFGVDGEMVLDPQTGLFSLLGLFAKVFVIDDIIDSLNLCKAYTIITTKPDEISRYIMQDIRHGVTTHPAKGAYTGADKTVIITVVRKSESLKLRRKVLEIDPNAFIIITKTSEIMGKGFRDNVN